MKNKTILISILALIIINSALYFKTKDFDFVNYDDNTYLVKNALVQDFDSAKFKTILTEPYLSNYQPLVLYTYAAEYGLFKLEPGGYHIVNVIIHIINSVLLLLLLYMITGSSWISLFVAVVFSLHPMQVESVAWVSELKGLMSAFFYFLSFIFYIRFSREGKRNFFYVSIVLFLFALLSKPMAVTFPVILLLFDYLENKLDKSKLIEKIPYFVITGVFSIVTVIVQKQGGSINIDRFNSLALNLIYAFHTIGFYVSKLIAPLNLSAHYGYEKIKFLSAAELSVSFLVIVALLAYAIFFKKIKRSINFGILFFLVSLLPILRFVPIGDTFAADRYMYIPLVGFFLAVIISLESFTVNRPLLKKIFVAIFVVYMVFLGVRNYKRSEVWRDNVSLWGNVLENYPDSVTAFIALRENYYSTLFDLGKFYYGQKDYERSRKYYSMLLDYEKIRKDALDYGVPHSTFDEAYPMSVFKDVQEKALYLVGITHLQENDLNNAAKYFSMLVKEYPNNAKGWMELGIVSSMSKDYDAAGRYYSKSVELAPKNPHVHYNYAIFLENTGRRDDAIKHYRLAADLDSGWALPKQALARLVR